MPSLFFNTLSINSSQLENGTESILKYSQAPKDLSPNINFNQLPSYLIQRGISQLLSNKVAEVFLSWNTKEPLKFWRKICDNFFINGFPFDEKKFLHKLIFKDWELSRSPIPACSPNKEEKEKSNIVQLQNEIKVKDIPALYDWSINNGNDFVDKMIQLLSIKFKKYPIKILSIPSHRSSLIHPLEQVSWLKGAKMNIVEWRAHSYYQAKARYKDEIISF